MEHAVLVVVQVAPPGEAVTVYASVLQLTAAVASPLVAATPYAFIYELA